MPPSMRAGGSDQESTGGLRAGGSFGQSRPLPLPPLSSVRPPARSSLPVLFPGARSEQAPWWPVVAAVAAADELASSEGSPGSLPEAKRARLGAGSAAWAPRGSGDDEQLVGPAERLLGFVLRAAASEGHLSCAAMRCTVLEQLPVPCEKLGKSATKRILSLVEGALAVLAQEAGGESLVLPCSAAGGSARFVDPDLDGLGARIGSVATGSDPKSGAARIAGRACLSGLAAIIGYRVLAGRLHPELRDQAERLGWLAPPSPSASASASAGSCRHEAPQIRVV